MGQGKAYSNTERNMILRVLAFFEDEKRYGYNIIPIKKAFARASAATGVAKETIRRIKNEAKKITSSKEAAASPSTANGEDPPPGVKDNKEIIFPKKKRQRPDKRLKIDDAMIDALREIIDTLKQNNEEPTLKKIFVASKKLGFPGQRESLRRIIKEKLGFQFKNVFPVSKKKSIGDAAASSTVNKKKKPIEYKRDTEIMPTMPTPQYFRPVPTNAVFAQMVPSTSPYSSWQGMQSGMNCEGSSNMTSAKHQGNMNYSRMMQ